MNKPTAVCPICGRRIPVADPCPEVTPWLKRHCLGKKADLRGGDTPRTICQGSMIGIRREAITMRAESEGRWTMDDEEGEGNPAGLV